MSGADAILSGRSNNGISFFLITTSITLIICGLMIVSCQLYIQYKCGLYSINSVTVKYVSAALVVILISIIFLSTVLTRSYTKLFIFVILSILVSLVNPSFIFKEYQQTFPIIKDIFSCKMRQISPS